MKIVIGSALARIRKEKKMSQTELAVRLREYGIHVKKAAISSWENDINIPTAVQLLAICEILSVYNIYEMFLAPPEKEKSLNVLGRKKLQEYEELLLQSDQYVEKKHMPMKEKDIPEKSVISVSMLEASAGTGEYLDDEN